MKQTENIGIGGYAFNIESDAYAELAEYLEEIRDKCGDRTGELVKDIEERIAELLHEKCGSNGIVTTEAVRTIKLRIGSPAEMGNIGNSQEEKASGKAGKSRKKLYRDMENRVLGGVFGGLGIYFGTDPAIIRIFYLIIFAISLSSPACIVVVLMYFALWTVIPAAKTVEEKCEMRNKPVDLDGFVRNFSSNVENTAKEIPGSPLYKSTVNIFRFILGIVLLTAGCGILVGCCLFDLIPGIIMKESDILTRPYSGDFQTLEWVFLNRNLWLYFTVSTAILGVWALYNGTIHTFRLKTAKWRPGTVLFILWILSLLFISIYIIRKAVIMGTMVL